MGNNKIKILVGLSAIGLVVVGLLVFTGKDADNTPYKATVTIDPDTGEKIITDTNQAENTNDDEYITLQGSDGLYNAMSTQQFNLLRDLIGQYARTSVSIDVQIVKVIPSTIKINEQETRGSFRMKIDDPAAELSAEIEIHQTEAVRIIIRNLKKPSEPAFDSGLTYVSDTEDEEYGGDGTPPEESGD